MESRQNNLNIEKLKDLIKNGMQAIPHDEKVKQAIIVIGDTGVGKSTVMNFLAGHPLMVRCQGLKPKLVCQQKTQIKIGHQKYSQTSIPTRTIIQNLAFYDCPGFRDNKGQEYQISNSFFVQQLLQFYPKVKIVLMIDQSHISQTRADKLPRLTKNLLRSFKSFTQMKEGVIMIINRADRDLGTQNYQKQIRKIIQLKNQRGFLFGQQQQNFLKYLVDNKKIKLFKQCLKKDKDKIFQPTEFEKDIMPSIRKSDFVKRRHITNIVSQSAKIAIRDYIDNLTLRTNQKVQKIAVDITRKFSKKFNQAQKSIPVLLEIKQTVMNLAENIRSEKDQNILLIIKNELPLLDLKDFEDDFHSVIFFKGIYDKTQTYFTNLINKTYSELTQVIYRMDGTINRLQKQQQEQIEKKQLILKRIKIKNQRETQKLQTMNQIKSINQIRKQINNMGKQSLTMIQSLGNTMSYLYSLEQQFTNLRTDTVKIKKANRQLTEQFQNFESIYINKCNV